MQSFIDKVVVVTGAASGMGRAYALEFGRLGAKLALNDFNDEGLQETLALLKAQGQMSQRMTGQAFDVSDRGAMFAFAQQVQAQFGPAHIVINNAGISGQGKHVKDMPFEDVDRVMRINFNGVLHGTQAFLPQLMSNAEAALVNVSSTFGLVGMSGNAEYCASKFAVRGLTEALMVELADSQVQVHLVHPGGVRTGIADGTEKGRKFAEKFLKTPPEDVVKAVVAGIRKKQARIVFGHQAQQTWWLSWVVPLGLRTKLLARVKRQVMARKKDDAEAPKEP